MTAADIVTAVVIAAHLLGLLIVIRIDPLHLVEQERERLAAARRAA